MVSASHTAAMRDTPQNFPDGNDPNQDPATTTLLQYTIPAYTLFDASLGIGKENWTLQIQSTNVTNVYGPTNINSSQFITSQVPLCPRTLMAQFACSF
jgi:hypothetical protein